jgi:hypothetical protein
MTGQVITETYTANFRAINSLTVTLYQLIKINTNYKTILCFCNKDLVIGFEYNCVNRLQILLRLRKKKVLRGRLAKVAVTFFSKLS